MIVQLENASLAHTRLIKKFGFTDGTLYSPLAQSKERVIGKKDLGVVVENPDFAFLLVVDPLTTAVTSNDESLTDYPFILEICLHSEKMAIVKFHVKPLLFNCGAWYAEIKETPCAQHPLLSNLVDLLSPKSTSEPVKPNLPIAVVFTVCFTETTTFTRLKKLSTLGLLTNSQLDFIALKNLDFDHISWISADFATSVTPPLVNFFYPQTIRLPWMKQAFPQYTLESGLPAELLQMAVENILPVPVFYLPETRLMWLIRKVWSAAGCPKLPCMWFFYVKQQIERGAWKFVFRLLVPNQIWSIRDTQHCVRDWLIRNKDDTPSKAEIEAELSLFLGNPNLNITRSLQDTIQQVLPKFDLSALRETEDPEFVQFMKSV